MKPELERYSRQVLFSELGEAGQTNLMQGRVLLCGCGALGTVLAETLVRAGVGQIKIVDRDFVEISNLQRQVLFDESDVAAKLPKAIAAAEKLKKINSTVNIEPIVADIDHTNILSLARDVDLILDGTDNFEVRYLINDVSLELGIPWIYCGCIGSTGQTMTILPGKTACLRCLIDTAPEPGSTETCDTAGILGPTVNVIASLEAVDAIKLLAGKEDLIKPVLTVVDIWEGSYRQMSVADLREKSGCKACHQGERVWLKGEQGSRTTRLCGRNAVQVAPADKGKIVFEDLAEKLKHSGEVDFNPYLLRLNLKNPDYEISLFRDGRAIIKGTDDPAVAKTVYARYIGSWPKPGLPGLCFQRGLDLCPMRQECLHHLAADTHYQFPGHQRGVIFARMNFYDRLRVNLLVQFIQRKLEQHRGSRQVKCIFLTHEDVDFTRQLRAQILPVLLENQANVIRFPGFGNPGIDLPRLPVIQFQWPAVSATRGKDGFKAS